MGNSVETCRTRRGDACEPMRSELLRKIGALVLHIDELLADIRQEVELRQ